MNYHREPHHYPLMTKARRQELEKEANENFAFYTFTGGFGECEVCDGAHYTRECPRIPAVTVAYESLKRETNAEIQRKLRMLFSYRSYQVNDKNRDALITVILNNQFTPVLVGYWRQFGKGRR